MGATCRWSRGDGCARGSSCCGYFGQEPKGVIGSIGEEECPAGVFLPACGTVIDIKGVGVHVGEDDVRGVLHAGVEDDEALRAVALLDGHAGECGDNLVVDGVGVRAGGEDAAFVDFEVLDHEAEGVELIPDRTSIHSDGVLGRIPHALADGIIPVGRQ